MVRKRHRKTPSTAIAAPPTNKAALKMKAAENYKATLPTRKTAHPVGAG
jgi:hypothetical protein